jgi:hypothetical protein
LESEPVEEQFAFGGAPDQLVLELLAVLGASNESLSSKLGKLSAAITSKPAIIG